MKNTLCQLLLLYILFPEQIRFREARDLCEFAEPLWAPQHGLLGSGFLSAGLNLGMLERQPSEVAHINEPRYGSSLCQNVGLWESHLASMELKFLPW